MAEIDELWRRGQFRAAYDASCRANAAIPDGYPFRTTRTPDEIAQRWHDHGQLAWHNARFAEADAAFERAYGLRERTHGADHPLALDTLERRAAVAHYLLDYRDAYDRFEHATAGLAAHYGDDHARVAIARRNHAACLRDGGRRAEARILIDRAIAVLERELPSEHPDLVAALKVDAMLHWLEGSHWAAIRSAERAIELGRRIWDDDHPFVATAELTLAASELQVGQRKRAARRFVRIVANLERAYGEHPLVAIALCKYAVVFQSAGDNLERAEELARRAFTLYRAFYPGRGFRLGWQLFTILVDAGRPIDAAELADQLDAEATDEYRFRIAARLANAFVRVRDHKSAHRWFERARDHCDDPAVRERWERAASASRLHDHG